MTGGRIKRWGLALASVFLLAAGGVRGQAVPKPMSPPRLVNDYAHLFSPEQQRVLEDSLVAFDAATSTQIAVVTVTDLDGYPAAEYATRILEQWGVGSREHDNGVVLLVKPRNRYGRGEMFIAVGYGLEGALPDITAGRIIDDEMIPYLQFDPPNYYAAVAAGTAAIRAAVRGEYTARQVEREPGFWDGATWILTAGVVFWIVILLIRSYKKGGSDDDDSNTGGRGGNGGRRVYRGRPMMFPPIFGRGFGGGSGGFGGFGGGRTGGGGAGRSF
ncbi:YgcG family protein [uncultured Rikenella sp.]|uniref:TPM domain-containing protein n=1 Tax=uncultured Rikenella sp. TaxID=368003 RepID=UPI0025D28DEA|nr:TPM domain-containing protein [uncultured Rikenella sp.]